MRGRGGGWQLLFMDSTNQLLWGDTGRMSVGRNGERLKVGEYEGKRRWLAVPFHGFHQPIFCAEKWVGMGRMRVGRNGEGGKSWGV